MADIHWESPRRGLHTALVNGRKLACECITDRKTRTVGYDVFLDNAHVYRKGNLQAAKIEGVRAALGKKDLKSPYITTLPKEMPCAEVIKSVLTLAGYGITEEAAAKAANKETIRVVRPDGKSVRMPPLPLFKIVKKFAPDAVEETVLAKPAEQPVASTDQPVIDVYPDNWLSSYRNDPPTFDASLYSTTAPAPEPVVALTVPEVVFPEVPEEPAAAVEAQRPTQPGQSFVLPKSVDGAVTLPVQLVPSEDSVGFVIVGKLPVTTNAVQTIKDLGDILTMLRAAAGDSDAIQCDTVLPRVLSL